MKEKLERPTITEVIKHFQGATLIRTPEGRLVSISAKDINDYTALIHENYFIVCEDDSYLIWNPVDGYSEIVGVSVNLIAQKRKALLVIGIALSFVISGLVSMQTGGTLHQWMLGIAAGLLGCINFMFHSRNHGFTFFRK